MSTPNSTIKRVTIDLAVVLGTSTMPVHQLLRMGRGAVIDLDTRENDEVVLLANNRPIARGVINVDQDRISFQITSMLKALPEAA